MAYPWGTIFRWDFWLFAAGGLFGSGAGCLRAEITSIRPVFFSTF